MLYETPIEPEKTLLFLDEIQACPQALTALRFFCEKMPALHVAAAGSLLEFAIAELPSFGVGRIHSLFMYPFGFAEFLNACGDQRLRESIENASPEKPLDTVLHNKALELLRIFLLIGGMPEVVATYVRERKLLQCQNILDDLLVSLRADFVKYKKRVPSTQISAALDSVVRQTGNKFIYTNREQILSAFQIKNALELLIMAGIAIPVTHTAANGLPLGAESNPKFRKILLLDTGLFQRLLGLPISEILLGEDFNTVNKGNIAEMFAGLELLKATPPSTQPNLFYWTREERSGRAEIDYIISRNGEIIPIEVKSGSSGKMQSLHLFMREKSSSTGVRCSLENFGKIPIATSEIPAKINIIPLYAIASLQTEFRAV